MNLDIGAIRRIVTAGRRPPSTIVALEGFAAAMTARHALRSTLASHVDLALAQVGHPEFNFFQGSQRIAAFPHIDVHIERRLDGAPMDLARPAPRADGFGEANGHARRARPADGFGEGDAFALYQRLLSRRERVPTFPTPVDASSARPLEARQRVGVLWDYLGAGRARRTRLAQGDDPGV